MKKLYNILLLILLVCLNLGSANLLAQDVIDLYVSKQTGKFTTYSGSYSKTTDKFEHGTGTITATGPISYTVTPPTLAIDTNQSITWNGSVFPNMSQAPEPGTSADGSLKLDYNIHFKFLGEMKEVNSSVSKEVKVHSLKITAPDTLLVPVSNSTTITAVGYPAGGTYHWIATAGGITVENEKTATPTIKNLGLTATPAEIWVKYAFDSVFVTKKVYLLGYKLITRVLDEDGKKLNKPLCDGKSGMVKVDIAPPNLKDRVLATITSITPTIVVKDGETNNGNVIGHTNIPIAPKTGESLVWNFGPAFWYSNRPDHCNNISKYQINFATQMAGLPNGTLPPEELRVSVSFSGCINGHANFNLSIPNLNFSPPLAFVPDPLDPNVMRIIATEGDYPDMVITQTFNANGKFAGYKYQFEIGKFKFSDVEIGIMTPTTSQFHQLTVDEENFHKDQFNGKNTNIALLNNLPTAQKIVNQVNADLANYRHNNAKVGAQFASNYFKGKIVQGVNLFNAMLAFGHANGLRCALEAEAKAAMEAKHGNIFKAAMQCAYPNCN